MKTNPRNLLAAIAAVVAITLAPTLRADDAHDHATHEDAKLIAGPNGGRILASVEPHLEFFVTKDRKVKITAVDDHGKAIPLGEQTVALIGGDRMNPTRLSFKKDGESLVSDKPLPEGNDFPVVVQIKVKPDAKTVTEKFNVNLSDCTTCEHAEYACICGH